MTRTSFVANVGGLLGLCMGFSLVSVAEILYFCIKRNTTGSGWSCCQYLKDKFKLARRSSNNHNQAQNAESAVVGGGGSMAMTITTTRTAAPSTATVTQTDFTTSFTIANNLMWKQEKLCIQISEALFEKHALSFKFQNIPRNILLSFYLFIWQQQCLKKRVKVKGPLFYFDFRRISQQWHCEACQLNLKNAKAFV